MGPGIKELEQQLYDFSGAKHSLTCSNDTGAMNLFLKAKGVGAGDAVIAPSFTFIATAETVCLAGATPIFVDVKEDSFNLDTETLDQGYKLAKEQGLGTDENAKQAFLQLKRQCQKVNGNFTLLWHNSRFPDQATKKLYEDVLKVN